MVFSSIFYIVCDVDLKFFTTSRKHSLSGVNSPVTACRLLECLVMVTVNLLASFMVDLIFIFSISAIAVYIVNILI